jgi:hypothetical protein
MEVAPKFVSPRSMWVSKLTLRCVTIGFDVIALALAGTDMWLGLLVMGPPVSSSPHFLSLCLVVETDPLGYCVSLLVRRGTHLHHQARRPPGHSPWCQRGHGSGHLARLDGLHHYVRAVWPHLLLVLPERLSRIGLPGESDCARFLWLAPDVSVLATSLHSTTNLSANHGVNSMLHFTTFVIACYETSLRNRLVAPTILVMQNPPNGTLPPGGQMQPLPGGQVYFQVLPGANGLPQQQVYYVPVQAMPGGQMAPLQTVLSPPAPAALAGNGVVGEQKMQGYA